jgi:hypothetical protein
MRVLIGPLAEVRLQKLASGVAESLAGPGGAVVSLRRAGVSDLSRLLSEAEVVRLREAMLGSVSRQSRVTAGEREDAVGYVCAGSLLTGAVDAPASGAPTLVAVTDHADLTWRSPLTGPNDDLVGPRFPSMTGVYAPEVVTSRSRTAEGISGLPIVGEGMIVIPGIVAGVRDDGCLSDHEAKMAAILDCAGASSELAPVAVVAAHLGLRVAAAVLTSSEGRETPGGGS